MMKPTLRERLHTIIFESETRAGKIFDVTLIILILVSVIAVIIESIPVIREQYGPFFLYLELFFTTIFTIEYLLRLYSVRRPMSYAFSFFGLIDFFKESGIVQYEGFLPERGIHPRTAKLLNIHALP